MTSIALLWKTPSPSKTLLEKFKFSFDFYRTMGWMVTELSSESNNLSSKRSYRGFPDGIMLENGKWEEILNKQTAHFEVTARVLNSYLDLQNTDSQPNLMRTLFHALLLFHEACLDQLPLLSIVNFAASLDVLTDGDGQEGIKRIIDSRLGFSSSHKIFLDGATVQETVTDIYKYARNKTMHGGNMSLGHDWSETRDRAEQLTRLCLNACLHWVFCNPTCDNPKHLSRSSV